MSKGDGVREPLYIRSRRARFALIIIGSLFTAIPIVAYLDIRLQLLGKLPKVIGDHDLMWSIFIVAGVLMMLSGSFGRLFSWGGVGVIESDVVHSESAAPELASHSAFASQDIVWPEGDQTKFNIVERADADAAFVEVAKEYYVDVLGGKGDNFEAALKRVFKSAMGRPNWVFYVEEPGRSSQKYRFIYVPHNGRGGSGPSWRGAR
ncbi:hypothetical protein [Galactobacter sp.]|uniref:hypothetical protein n=1 Tax=Galactobacter sp. TaxID=2676125 RepID=UPI0025C58966|nr:hypothetical protein [Galactobacter sp.]